MAQIATKDEICLFTPRCSPKQVIIKDWGWNDNRHHLQFGMVPKEWLVK